MAWVRRQSPHRKTYPRLLCVALAAPAVVGCALPELPRTVGSQQAAEKVAANLPNESGPASTSSPNHDAQVAQVVFDGRGPTVAQNPPGPAPDRVPLGESPERATPPQPPRSELAPPPAVQKAPPIAGRESNREYEQFRGTASIPAPGTVATQPRSVEYFIGQALTRHPSIIAARQRVAAEVNRIPQVSALPDPMFSNTFWPIQDQALQTAAGRVGNQMSVTQQVPWPEKLRAKAAIVSREVQVAQAEVERIERQITESVRLAYYEVWYAARAITIVEETQQLVNDLGEVAEARYRSGGSQQDVIRAQLENDRLEDQLVTLRKQKRMAEADLAALLQQPLGAIPAVMEELDLGDAPAQLEELVSLAEQCNPELRGLLWEYRRDREKQRLACLQQYPDLQFGVHWGLINDDDNVISPVANGHDNISFTVGTTLPIWHDKIDGGIREAALRSSSTSNRLEAERDEIYGRLRRLLAQADALVAQRAIFADRIIPRVEDTLRLAFSDYRGQRTDFYSLVDTYRELLLYETQLARIDANLAGTIAQINRTVGCPE